MKQLLKTNPFDVPNFHKMKKIYFITLLLFFISKSAYSQTGYLGEVRIFAGNFAPANWLKCEGQLINISENETLFTVIGTTYGGDGETTFALPDYRGRTTIGASSSIPEEKKIGNESVSLLVANLPAHSHNSLLQVSSSAATLHTPDANSVIAPPSVTINNTSYPIAGFTSVATGTDLITTASSAVGSGVPVFLSQPSLVLTYIICVNGYFPSPN